MNLVRLLLIAIFLSGCGQFRAALAVTQDKPVGESQQEKENEYLTRLKKRLEENIRLFKKMDLDIELPPSLQNLYSNVHKPLEFQIEKAEERIKRGLPFGKKEYEAALKAMEKQANEDAARRSKEADLEYHRALEKSELEYRRKMEASRRRLEKSRRETDRKHQLRVNAANLKLKFDTAPGPSKLVVWNLPVDRALHDRFTTGVNIHLYLNGRSVWSRKNVALDRKAADNHFELPKVAFDRISVEVVKWQGVGGGLSEIEVFVGGENVAANRPSRVSNSETVPRYLDDQQSITDGIRVPQLDAEGYWIAEEDVKASVSVDLIGELVERQ